MASSTQQLSCGYVGDPDLYGLGIRVSFYLQWTSACIMCNGYPESHYSQGRGDLQAAYTIFVFALTIAIIVITADDGPKYAADIIIPSYILFGGTFTTMIMPDTFKAGSIERQLESSTNSANLGINAILSIAFFYYAWFWIHGAFHNFLPTDCGTYLFLFSRVSLSNGSATRFLAALFIYLGVGSITSCILILYMLFNTLWTRNKSKRKDPFVWFMQSASAAEEDPVTITTYSNFFTRLYSVFIPIYSILGVELCIRWNHIRGVNDLDSPGQLIPFVIGLAGFLKTIWPPIKEFYRHKYPKSPSRPQSQGSLTNNVELANNRLRHLDLALDIKRSTVSGAQARRVQR